ncbi:MAG: hypothetical protein C0472_11490 [Erythrobacter sp.]|nr:hypothetical protein [Erythrobacter sp.]
MVAKIKDIKKKLPAARSATKADVTRKLADGLPIASMKNGEMVVEQLIEVEEPQFVAKAVSASSMAVMTVKPVARRDTAARPATAERKSYRKSASAA